MGRYNLLEEKWIPVLLNEKGDSEKVSIIELFENAPNYISLAADTQTQKFALLRFLLSIPQTVYFRFDVEGNPYDYFDVDEKYRQIEEVEDEDVEKFKLNLGETWKDLWNLKSYSKILFDYLEAWRDRFYLFDDKYPFYQVTEDVIFGKDLKQKTSVVFGKEINRTISESNNKVAMFSPKYEANNNKELMEEDEIARWLLNYQGYSGISDKCKFKDFKYDATRGWLYYLGGVYLEGENLFETLMLNTILGGENNFYFKKQKPCWEYTGEDIVKRALINNCPDNLAELYTTWGKAIYISPVFDASQPFKMNVIKFPAIDISNKFLEPMTMWKNEEGRSGSDDFSPIRFPVQNSMWRSFGNLLVKSDEKKGIKRPGIIDWYSTISNFTGDNNRVVINSISLYGNPAGGSHIPINEVYDRLDIKEIIIEDVEKNGWNEIVFNTIEETKECISSIYRMLLYDINEIRNLKDQFFVNRNTEEMYYIIDLPFTNWLYSIDENSSKEEKVFEWRKTLKELIEKQARRLVEFAGARDYKGIEVERKDKKGKKIKNIATSYSLFKTLLNKKIKIKEEEYAGEIE